MRKSLIIPLLLLAFVFGGIFTIILSKVITNRNFYFPLKLEVDVVGIFSLIVTVWLAYFVSMVLDKRSNSDLNVALLVSAKIDNIVRDLKDYHKELNLTSKLPLTVAVSFSKTLALNEKTIRTFLEKDPDFVKAGRAIAFKTDFTNYIREIKNLTTYTSPNITITPQDVVVNGSNYEYSESRIELIGLELQKLEELLIILQYDFFNRK
jgi:hypothetical protein